MDNEGSEIDVPPIVHWWPLARVVETQRRQLGDQVGSIPIRLRTVLRLRAQCLTLDAILDAPAKRRRLMATFRKVAIS